MKKESMHRDMPPRRRKTDKFTLIEILIKITCQIYLYAVY